MKGTARVSTAIVAGVIILVCVPVGSLVAQNCPFPDSVAIADTLDPAGYLPLEVGNVWEYWFPPPGPSPAERRTVLRDTTIYGTEFAVVKRVRLAFNESWEVVAYDSALSYEAIVSGQLLSWDASSDSVVSTVDFTRDFKSCGVETAAHRVVDGGYGGSAFLFEDTVDVAARKWFWGGGVIPLDFAYEVGELRRVVPRGFQDLVGARIGGVWLGTTLDTVFTKILPSSVAETPDFEPPSVEIFPNPMRGTGRVTVFSVGASQTRIDLVDVLGRVVRQALVDRYLGPGLHEEPVSVEGLPPGLYFLSIKTETGPVRVKPIMVTSQ